MKKNFERVLSLILTLILILGGVDFASIINGGAKAEDDHSVPATPETVLEFGEWRYWVEDGCAYVAGYANMDETSLTIPFELGGYPVVGIGEGAFAENSMLQSIVVYSTVNNIGKDAFNNSFGISIFAYHGAYALTYADENGIAGKAIEGKTKFADNVIDLTGISTKSYRKLTESSVEFDANAVSFIRVGQVVYFPAQMGYPTGLARKIDAISPKDGILYVSMSQPEWGEAFSDVFVEDKLYIDWANAIPAEGVEIENENTEINGQSTTTKVKIGSIEYEYEENKSVSLSVKKKFDTLKGYSAFDLGHIEGQSEKQTVTVEGKVKLALDGPIDASAHIYMDGILPKIDKANVKMPLHITSSFKIKAESKGGYLSNAHKMSFAQTSKGTYELLVDLPIVSIGGIINGCIGIYLDYSLTGECSVKYEILYNFNVELNNGRPVNKSTKKELSKTVEAAGEFTLGPRFAFYLNIGYGGFSIKMFETSMSISLKVNASAKMTKLANQILSNGKNLTITCLDAELKVVLSTHVEIGIIDVLKHKTHLSYEINWEWEVAKKKIGHLENGELTWNSECSMKDRRVKFCNNNPITGLTITSYAIVDVNHIIPEPDTPACKGFTFAGWYVDAKESRLSEVGLGSKDTKWNFEKNVMPWLPTDPKDVDLVLYAKWIDKYPVTKVTLNQTQITGYSNAGTQVTLSTTVAPSNANNKKINWSSSNTNVATVSKNGVVTLKNAGTAVITAASDNDANVKATCKVTVNQSVTGISMDSSITRYSDDLGTVQLNAVINPTNAYDKSVVWTSSNPAVAEVSETGLVTLKSVGKADIVCRSVQNSKISATCQVNILQAVTGITLNETELYRTNADMSNASLRATVSPADAYNKAVTWESSNPAVATVSADGTVAMKALGSATITCRSVSNPAIKAECSILITQAVTEITLNENSVTCYSDKTDGIQLTATVKPDSAGNKSVCWESSNENVVSVNGNGLVTVKGAGNAVVTCRSISNPNVTAECRFTVLQAVTKIVLNRSEYSCNSDEISVIKLMADVYPHNAANRSVTWTSGDDGVASVMADGTVIVKGVGSTTITCRSVSTPAVYAVFEFEVTPAVSGITLSDNNIIVYSGETNAVQLTADINAQAIADRTVTWESDNDAVASVTGNGIIEIKGIGEAIITCTSVSNPDVSAQCRITVLRSVAGITLNRSSMVKNSNDTAAEQLSATIEPADASNKNVVWYSSNNQVAVVSDTGVVTVTGAGNTVIGCYSVSNPDVSAECTIEVRQGVDSLVLSSEVIERASNETGDIVLAAYIYPASAYNKSVVWSSNNESVAKVDNQGKVEIIGVGSAVISCVSNDNTIAAANCTITVKQAVTGITLNKTGLDLLTSDASEFVLNASVVPVNAENKGLVWSSSDERVATVSDNGTVTVLGLGMATISCTSVSNNEVSAECRINVQQAVEGIILSSSSIECYGDDKDEFVLTAYVLPEDAYNKNVVWSSSNEDVADVSENGIVTIKGIGSAQITCSSKSNPEVSTVCTINAKQPMTGILLNTERIDVYENSEEEIVLVPTIVPEMTDDTELIWSSNDENIAVVDGTGHIVPVSQGTVTITCKSARNPETIKATCSVTIKQYVREIAIEGSAVSVLPGEQLQLTAVCVPESADDLSVIWSSSDDNVAVVDADGKVTGVSYGTAVITATAADGSEAKATYSVTVEHELALTAEVINDTVYTIGDEEIVLAYVSMSDASVRRMNGEIPNWTLEKQDDGDDVKLELIESDISFGDDTYDTTVAVLRGSSFKTAGTKTYDVTCEVAGYSESSTISINVDGGDYAESVSLPESVFTVDIGEAAVISAIPTGNVGKAVPSDIHIISIDGDMDYTEHAEVTYLENDNVEVVFDESGIYTAEVTFAVANVTYVTNAAFYVRDENGIVHIKVSDIALNSEYETIVQGDELKLTAEVMPVDAFDTSVNWSSSDETVATVDENGTVHAVNPGIAAIICTANDGSQSAAMCSVNVEKFLQIDESNVAYTVYTGGSDHADLDIINVTIESGRRLTESGLNVTWTLEKLSGNSTEISVEEFTSTAEEGLSVSGNKIKLLRIYCEGSDEYKLTCCAGEYSDSCNITITAVSRELPAEVVLDNVLYRGVVGDIIAISADAAIAVLPEETVISVEGGRAFESALSGVYTYGDPLDLIFDRAGVYTATVTFSGKNYTYECPVTITVEDLNGEVPANVTDIEVDSDYAYMTVGEQQQLTATVMPVGAAYSKMTWTTSDSSVVSVSSTGKLTAIGAGRAYVSVSVPEYDYSGSCMVIVEDGLTLQQEGIERTVYLDGNTRMVMDHVQLTAASSRRLTDIPEWNISRVSGNNLTLKVDQYNVVDSENQSVYGCEIILYSLSREGDTVYELSCKSGDEVVCIPVTVHAVRRDSTVPAALKINQDTYTANVGEVVSIETSPLFIPEGTKLPDGVRVLCEGDSVFNNAVNANDFYVSQSLVTLSMSRAGLYEINLIYTYSNLRYVIPVTIRIMDENGNVPILSKSVSLSNSSLFMQKGETATLSAVFTPANADNRKVEWTSFNEDIAQVDDAGNVTALANGRAVIYCVPDDPYLNPMTCIVFVEDYLSAESAEDSVALYKQGQQSNEVFGMRLTTGTIMRLDEDGVEPVWTLNLISGNACAVEMIESKDGRSVVIMTTELICSGVSEYELSCVAGDHEKTCRFIVEVLDIPGTAEYIEPAQKTAYTDIGEPITLDFTPVCYPQGSSMPNNDDMWDIYSGLGWNYYEAMDYSAYVEDGDRVTVCFTKPGSYLISRQFFLGNLHYSQVCEIIVGEESAFDLIEADATDVTVFLGGKAGTLMNVEMTDALVEEVFDGELSWKIERISGSSIVAALKPASYGVEVYTVNALSEGEDVWRVTCSFGEFSESVDVHVTVIEPANPVPDSVTIAIDELSGMSGDWLSMPIAPVCEPTGSRLPETGDEFWRFEPTGVLNDVCEWNITDGLLRVKVFEAGYYTGTLVYEAGNFKYRLPVYLSVTDEEEVLNDPILDMYLIGMPDTVYIGGSEEVALGTAAVSRGTSTYFAGEAVSYMKTHEGVWSIRIISGDAADLSVSKSGYSSAVIMLDEVKHAGNIEYEVSCTIGNTVYSKAATLSVVDAGDNLPVPELENNVYYVNAGETLVISTALRDKNSGMTLQSASEWNPDAFLSAIGYEYNKTDSGLETVFYVDGTYNSLVRATVGNIVYELPLTIIVGQGVIPSGIVLYLPPMLKNIGARAFMGSSVEEVDIRGTNVVRIGEKAFSSCENLVMVHIPSTVIQIASDAFDGSENVTIGCQAGSYAEEYAIENGLAIWYE